MDRDRGARLAFPAQADLLPDVADRALGPIVCGHGRGRHLPDRGRDRTRWLVLRGAGRRRPRDRAGLQRKRGRPLVPDTACIGPRG